MWLDPDNAAAFARAAAEALAARDPDNAGLYRSNADAFAAELNALETRLEARLAASQGRPFLVFHDAYQYFETRFGLTAAGSILLGDASSPSAARMAEARAVVADTGAACVFTEPQFSARLAAAVIEGSNARKAMLDPLGAEVAPGPDHYVRTLEAMGDAIADCLG